ncbi:MAG: hypothetical protein FWD50_06530, partial [Betaproteobacteria bacterium]|nr:hypothetical protein [Betaproteobacteria bacterium]
MPIARQQLALGLLAAIALPAWAQTAYVDAQGNQQLSPVIATTLTSGRTITLERGWYLCSEPLSIHIFAIRGDVNLILGNDCDMRVTGSDEDAGINVTGDNSLTIWAQSIEVDDESGSYSPSTQGSLTANGGFWGAGIGGSMNGAGAGGTITINGGTVNANGGHGAGIGGSKDGAGGTTTINGGTVNATSKGGAGIGSGFGWRKDSGMVTINGGLVIASSDDSGAGIGGGTGNHGGTIIINGGTVYATSKRGGAGIGGGSASHGGTITIHGGYVKAVSDWGAGIGGGSGSSGSGSDGAGGTITIDGGIVKAIGGGESAGIGSGTPVNESALFDAGTITITMTERMKLETLSGASADAYS